MLNYHQFPHLFLDHRCYFLGNRLEVLQFTLHLIALLLIALLLLPIPLIHPVCYVTDVKNSIIIIINFQYDNDSYHDLTI